MEFCLAIQEKLMETAVGVCSLLVPANAHITRIVNMLHFSWLLHVSAGCHPQGTLKPDKVKYILV